IRALYFGNVSALTYWGNEAVPWSAPRSARTAGQEGKDMKLPIALGIAAAALTVAAASAQSISRHVVIHGDSDSVSRIDANEDGWVTRAEASSAYERIFGELDTNNDGRLDNADRRNIRVHVDAPNV